MGSRHEANRELNAAAHRSPELAAMLAGRHDDPAPRYRRIAVLAGAAAAAVAIAWGLASVLPRPKRAEPALEIDRSVYLLPIETQPTGTGEETSPFTGFAVSVDTEPAGAVVTIAGELRGEAPVLASVTCRGADKVELRAEKPGFRPVRRALACRADTLVKLTLRLER
jgi:hypothetical protein